MAIKMVNPCGYSVELWDSDGWCRVCGNQCNMSGVSMIDERIYNFALTHGFTCGRTLIQDDAVDRIGRYFEIHKKTMPKYIEKYIQQNKT